MSTDPTEYVAYWAAVTDRSPREVYVPLALRTEEAIMPTADGDPRWYTLPDADTLANALVSVDGNGRTVRGLYPKILSYAGTAVTPAGFVIIWLLAIDAFVKDLPPATRVITEANIAAYAKAIISDEEVLALTLQTIKNAGLGIEGL